MPEKKTVEHMRLRRNMPEKLDWTYAFTAERTRKNRLDLRLYGATCQKIGLNLCIYGGTPQKNWIGLMCVRRNVQEELDWPYVFTAERTKSENYLLAKTPPYNQHSYFLAKIYVPIMLPVMAKAAHYNKQNHFMVKICLSIVLPGEGSGREGLA